MAVGAAQRSARLGGFPREGTLRKEPLFEGRPGPQQHAPPPRLLSRRALMALAALLVLLLLLLLHFHAVNVVQFDDGLLLLLLLLLPFPPLPRGISTKPEPEQAAREALVP